MHDLISLGDTTVDVFLKIHDASVVCTLDTAACQLCFNYADKIPVEELKIVAAVGNAANNAIGSTRLGLKTALWTILGKDEEGESCAQILKREKVNMRYVQFDCQRRTNYSTVLNFRSERTILVYHEERKYRLPSLGASRWIYLTSMGKGWETTISPLLRYLNRTKARLAFNPGTYQMKSGLGTLKRLIAHAEVFIVNREEANRILRRQRESIPALLRAYLKLGARTVVITEGTRGSHAATEGKRWFLPTFRIPARERTGAGDSYSTGFLVARCYGKSVGEAMRWGTANASSVIQYVGAREGLLTRAGIYRMLRRFAGVQAKEYKI
jgi:sugar/nucleoside kinase (ribokinase family)